MHNSRPHRRSILRAAWAGAGCLATGAVFAQPAWAAIAITRPTRRGGGPNDWDLVEGSASVPLGVAAKVAFYSETDRIYCQPWPGSLLDIAADGRWGTRARRGWSNIALLVQPSFVAPAILPAVPPVGGPVLAVTRVACPND